MTNPEEMKPDNDADGVVSNHQAVTGQMTMLAVVAISSMISIIVALIGYIAFVQTSPKPIKFATVDIAEVVQIKELIVTTSISKPGTTDLEREKAFDEIGNFGSRLETAIAEMQNECGCIIFVRAAVIKGIEDLTPVFKEKVGLGGISREMAMAKFTGKDAIENSNAEKRRGNQ